MARIPVHVHAIGEALERDGVVGIAVLRRAQTTSLAESCRGDRRLAAGLAGAGVGGASAASAGAASRIMAGSSSGSSGASSVGLAGNQGAWGRGIGIPSFNPSYSVRPNGAVHQWREDPRRELSVDPGS
jgi:hypothetical protein